MSADDGLLDRAIAEARTTPDEVHDALIGLIGLVQLICTRDDVPDDVKALMRTHRRYVDAREVAKAVPMSKELDGKLFAAALYVITEMWSDTMGDLQRASLANQIVREIQRRQIFNLQQ